MIPPHFRAHLLLPIAALISFSVSAGARADPAGGLRIDLSESDPARLEELPGILPAEIEQLRAAAGPGEDLLGERLATTGIAEDRLLRWAPFLVLPDRGIARCVWKVRLDAARRTEKPLARRTRLRMDRGAVSASFDGSMNSSAEGQSDPRAWLAIRHPRGAGIRVGTIAGGFRGMEPWDDPLAAGRGVAPLQGRISMRDDGDSRGAILELSRWTGALWSSGTGSGGTALSANLKTVGAWVGSEGGGGWGSGVSIRGSGRDAAIAWSDPRGFPPSVRFSLTSKATGELCAAWPVRSRSDRRLGSLAARRAGRYGSLSWSARTEMVVAQRKGDSQGRIDAAARLNQRAWAWDCRIYRRTGSSSLELGIDPRLGAAWIPRFEHRGRLAHGRYRSLGSCRLTRDASASVRLECALFMRDSSAFSWPDPGAGLSGRAAARLGLTAALREARCRVQILATDGGAGRNPAVGWRIELEHSAEG